MTEYDKNKESSFLKYWDVNNLYGQAMSQKLPLNSFEQIKDISQFNEDHEERDGGYFLKLDVQYLEKLYKIIKIEKVEKLVINLHDKTEYTIHIRNLKQALNHGLVLETVHRVIKFNQNAWIKPYTDMNTELRKISFCKNYKKRQKT